MIATADTLDAQSATTADGITVTSDDTGTSFANLCIQQTALPDPCTIITVPGPVSVSIPGVAVGTITVQDEATRTTEGVATGSGLTVTMLHVDLAVTGGQDVLDIAQADTFIGDVVEVTPTPAPATDTPTPTSAPPTHQRRLRFRQRTRRSRLRRTRQH